LGFTSYLFLSVALCGSGRWKTCSERV